MWEHKKWFGRKRLKLWVIVHKKLFIQDIGWTFLCLNISKWFGRERQILWVIIFCLASSKLSEIKTISKCTVLHCICYNQGPNEQSLAIHATPRGNKKKWQRRGKRVDMKSYLPRSLIKREHIRRHPCIPLNLKNLPRILHMNLYYHKSNQTRQKGPK